MKLRIFLSLVAFSLLLLIRCTDKELYEPIKKIYPDHCSNGIIDGDELDVDCGGECAPCGTITAPCNPDTNIVTFDSCTYMAGFPNTIRTVNMFSGGHINTSGNYEMTGTSTGSYIVKIILSGQRPTTPRVYDLSGQGFSSYYPGNGQVFFDFQTGTVFSTSGKLYVTPFGNSLIFTFCHAKLSWTNYGIPQTFSIYKHTYGRIVCPN
jgi:hypothetical protein